MKNSERLREEMEDLVPPEIKVRKELLYGRWYYIFQHIELGDIGRISVRNGHLKETSLFVAEINAGIDDPDREEKEKILFPIVENISNKMISYFNE